MSDYDFVWRVQARTQVLFDRRTSSSVGIIRSLSYPLSRLDTDMDLEIHINKKMNTDMFFHLFCTCAKLRWAEDSGCGRVDPDPAVGNGQQDGIVKHAIRNGGPSWKRRVAQHSQGAIHSHDHPSGFRRRNGKGIEGGRGSGSAVPRLLVCGFVRPTLRILASL